MVGTLVMDEVIVLPWAHDVLCNAQPLGTRLDRLRTIAGTGTDMKAAS